MSIEIFDDDIEQLRDDLSVEPWNVISMMTSGIHVCYRFASAMNLLIWEIQNMVLIRISLKKIPLSTLTA